MIKTEAVICFALAVVCASLSAGSVEARIRRYDWEVKYEYRAPDCYKKLAITVNGMSPGPTIKARQGDYIVVRVKNSLMTENLSIHWHGIRQIGSPWFDGTEGVTQCAVTPGETFVYRFVVDRPGTYLYHAHYGMQREAGLFGMIQVDLPRGESEPFSYDDDQSIILTDWWHKSTYEQSVGLSSIPFVWVQEPQSLLIQGRGRYDCSLISNTDTTCNSTSPDCAPFVMDVVPGKTYRLRVASLTGLSALSFEIEGHNMTVVEADGHYVDPFTITNLFIYSGETYSVLITANQDPTRNYWITTNIVSRKPTTPTGLSILNYNKPNNTKPTTLTPPTKPTTGPIWNNTSPRLTQSLAIKALKSHHTHTPPPQTTDRLIIFLNTQNKVNGNIRWSVNNVSFTLPSTPYLIAMKQNLHNVFTSQTPPNGYDYTNYDIFSVPKNVNATISDAVYRLDYNSTIDVVLQNANTMTVNNSETHPWHLHGHDFWVLGYGEGKFDPLTDPKNYNLVNPIEKNTVPVHPYGWTAIRFKANNPGVWLFHCHIESHFYMGMGVVFAEAINKVGKLPNSIMGCGESKRFLRP